MVVVLLYCINCPLQFNIHVSGEMRVGCFIFIVFMMNYGCQFSISVSLPQNAMCWPAVCTVNSENFARVLFCETLHMRSFVKIKPSRYSEITPSSTEKGKTCPNREVLASQICPLNLSYS